MLAMASHAQQRTTVDIRSWQFSRDSVEWQSVRIPHDWAIAGPFDKKWDLQNVAIEQNGEKQKTEKSGRSGALPWIGEGLRSFSCSNFEKALLILFNEPTWLSGKRTIRDCSAKACRID